MGLCENSVTMQSPVVDKIRLFRGMFMGRQDVYARRWENAKTGKAGYSPVCKVEWARGVCDKKRTPCAICPNRQLLPLTDEALEAHLRGKDAQMKEFVMGVYPLLADDTVRFAALDFDKKTWRSDSNSVCKTIRELGLPVARERSRSGNGAHVWFFFDSPQPAVFVRDVLSYILSLTIERNPEVGLDSYDRIFPNQDRLPKGGFGNLIALPLQKKARAAGNSCFVDDRLVPYADQWKFLSDLPFVTTEQLKNLRSRVYAEKRALVPQREEEIERNEPWSLFSPDDAGKDEGAVADEPITGTVEITLGNAAYIRQEALTSSVRGRLVRLASFVNPEHAEAQRMRRSVHNIPRVIDRSENGDDFLILPRGCLENAVRTISAAGGNCQIVDRRQQGSPLAVEFQGELRLEQKDAARELLKHDTGILAAGTAFGKTVLAAWMIAARKVNTLVLVNRKQLQDQWVTRLSNFWEFPGRRLDVSEEVNIGRRDDWMLSLFRRWHGWRDRSWLIISSPMVRSLSMNAMPFLHPRLKRWLVQPRPVIFWDCRRHSSGRTVIIQSSR